MTVMIKDLFASNINRHIEEVIKVDQTDEQIIADEVSEYVATDVIRGHFKDVLERYLETPNKPHEGIAVWVSGFFGSGKSSFAKILGLALENRPVLGQPAGERFARRAGDRKLEVLLRNISERVPTNAVIFDVSTDRGIRSGNQTLTEIMYRLFLQRLGYARDLDLSELEITLEGEGRLDEFKQAYASIFSKDWDAEKGKVAFAIQQASRVMHELDPATFPTVDSWRESANNRADITPGLLAQRCKELMARRGNDRTLVFVIDEVGQFVARDIQKMLDLMGVVQSLGRVGRGKFWIVVTSQEKLGELVGGLDDKRVELARLMDRFPLQVHLEPSDISEVTSKRILAKNANAQKSLRELFGTHRGRLTDNTRLTADIRLPELTTESFVDMYPLLPYQVDLIISVVSGLRTQGGALRHVGGANRTIIKLAQQLLIHPDVNLAGQQVGALATVDKVYDLIANNISSEVRGKIDAIRRQVEHPLAQPVAKAICLLQFVQSVHGTVENIAAGLHPAVDADSRLPEVREAVEALKSAHMIREGEGGYRIPTPAEDDWERQRSGLSPKPGDSARIHAEVVFGLWQPQPSHNFMGTKVFKAGLALNGRSLLDGDILVHVALAEPGKEYQERVDEMRMRSQTETKSIFWVAELSQAVLHHTDEVFRSQQMITRKERGAKTKEESRLVFEEKTRLSQKLMPELRRFIKQALLSGTVFFRGNDRSPDESASDVGRTAAGVLDQALPEVFERFEEGAARVQKADLDSLLTTENLRGLTPVFTALKLIRDQGGSPVFNTDSGPLAEVCARIENRTSYGDTASGRYLTDEFAKEPFGWDFDVVRLFVICLLRAGKVEATSKGQVIDSALSLDARNTFPNNNLFRSASFRPHQMGTTMEDWCNAEEAFQKVFGKHIPELQAGAVAHAIRHEVAEREQQLQEVHTLLSRHDLPGVDVLSEAFDQVRTILRGNDDTAILTFNASHNELREAFKRCSDLAAALTEPHLHDIQRARSALRTLWPFLDSEADLDDAFRDRANQLADMMARETFYRELPATDQHARALEEEYGRRYDEAADARAIVCADALEQLRGQPGWGNLSTEQREQVSAPLASRAEPRPEPPLPIPQLRSDVDACPGRLAKAIEEMMRVIDGQRVVRVNVMPFFSGGIETEEQLDAALAGLREECERLIGEGKKILVQ